MTNFSDETEAPISRSEEDVELMYIDPSHLGRALRIGLKLSADDKVRFKDFLSNNLDVFA